MSAGRAHPWVHARTPIGAAVDRADYPTCDQILTDPDRVNIDTSCRCGGSDHLVIATRLETRPWGGYSLAGAATKYAARTVAYATCPACRHVSRDQNAD